MKKTTKKENKNIVEQYKAIVKVIGKVYEATGLTAREAISNLKPQNCKGRAILVIEHGEARKEKILMPAVTFRLFNGSGFSRDVALKNASILFDGI